MLMTMRRLFARSGEIDRQFSSPTGCKGVKDDSRVSLPGRDELDDFEKCCAGPQIAELVKRYSGEVQSLPSLFLSYSRTSQGGLLA